MTEYMIFWAALLSAIATAVRWYYWREYKARNSDKMLFLTHTPNAFQAGNVHDGNVITRLVQVGPTALINGGRAPCWEVYGKPEKVFSMEYVPATVAADLLKTLEKLVESYGYTSYISDEEKEADPDITAARAAIAQARKLGF